MKKEAKQDAVPKEVLTIAWILIIGAFMPMLDSTIVNVAIQHLGTAFHTTLSSVQWVVTGYVLVIAIVVPISGWLSLRFNGRWLFFGANIIFLLGSILSGLSWNIDSMIIFRIFQGIGAGLIMPILTTMMMQTAKSDMMGRLIATVGLPMVLGPILGPVIGGMLIQSVSWRWIFFVNIPLGILALILIVWKLPDYKPLNTKAKLDFVGISLLGASSGTLIYGIVEAAKKATFNNNMTIRFVIAGVAILLGYIVYAAIRKEKAIVPLSLFKLSSFNAVMVGLFLAGIATNGPMLLLPLFFQTVKGFSVINAGLILIPQGIGMLLARPVIGKLTDKLGARNVVLVSIALATVGTIPFLYFGKSASLILVSVALLVRGMGIGGVTLPMMADAYTGMKKQAIAQASVATRISQNIGGAFGTAVLTTVVTLSLQDKVPTIAHMATSYHNGFGVSLVASLIVLIPALFLTNKKPEPEDE